MQFEAWVKRTYEPLLAGPGGRCVCSNASTCNDSLFCKGTEICQASRCAAGALPCVDGNPGTTDVCVESTDTCSHAAVPPPAEVATLNVNRSAPASPVAALAWSSGSGANTYDVYRAATNGLGDLACFATGVTGTTANDGVVPTRAYYYLVTSLACGSGTVSRTGERAFFRNPTRVWLMIVSDSVRSGPCKLTSSTERNCE